jgi:hypothetical protein
VDRVIDITETVDPPLRTVLSRIGVDRELLVASEPVSVLRAFERQTRALVLDSTSLAPTERLIEVNGALVSRSAVELCHPEDATCEALLEHRSVRAYSGMRDEFYIVGQLDGAERLVIVDMTNLAAADLPIVGVDATGREHSLSIGTTTTPCTCSTRSAQAGIARSGCSASSGAASRVSSLERRIPVSTTLYS